MNLALNWIFKFHRPTIALLFHPIVYLEMGSILSKIWINSGNHFRLCLRHLFFLNDCIPCSQIILGSIWGLILPGGCLHGLPFCMGSYHSKNSWCPVGSTVSQHGSETGNHLQHNYSELLWSGQVNVGIVLTSAGFTWNSRWAFNSLIRCRKT